MKRTPKDQDHSHRTLTRRTLVLGGLQLGFTGALAMRMRFLQVDQADQFRLLAEENRINIRLLAPSRGEIYDRNGIIIAQNSPSYRIVLVPEDAGDVEGVIENLTRLLPLDTEDLERARAEMRRSRPFLPITLADQLSWDDISKVAVNAPALPGITPEVGLSRVYPQGADFAHVVGYVGPVSDYDLSKMESPDPVLLTPGSSSARLVLNPNVRKPCAARPGPNGSRSMPPVGSCANWIAERGRLARMCS